MSYNVEALENMMIPIHHNGNTVFDAQEGFIFDDKNPMANITQQPYVMNYDVNPEGEEVWALNKYKKKSINYIPGKDWANVYLRYWEYTYKNFLKEGPALLKTWVDEVKEAYKYVTDNSEQIQQAFASKNPETILAIRSQIFKMCSTIHKYVLKTNETRRSPFVSDIVPVDAAFKAKVEPLLKELAEIETAVKKESVKNNAIYWDSKSTLKQKFMAKKLQDRARPFVVPINEVRLFCEDIRLMLDDTKLNGG